MDPIAALSRAVLLVGALASVATLFALARPGGRWGVRLRRRFVLGVPWGTLLTVALVAAVYLFVQGGWSQWYRPLVVPFRAWSYFYPLGMLTAGLAHSGPGHLMGNLFGTLVFGTLAEYAWSHFPTRRGSESFVSLRTNPFARILAVPVAAALLSVTTGLFALGPVIGFSGVVFAFAGFALVRYPVAAVVLLAAGDLVGLLYRSWLTPVVSASGSVGYSTPWWSGIAIQGHAVGVFTGFVLAVLLFRARDELPSPGKVWLGAVAYAAAQGLWAVYLFEGGDSYVLYRAAGLGLVFLLAAVVTAAATASRRDLVAAIDLSRREAAVGLLVAVLLALSLAAVPYNLLTVDDVAPEEGSVEVRDYTVFYAEGVTDQYVAAYDLPFYEASNVTTSGLVVASDRRQVWWTAASRGQIAFAGRGGVRIGGLGWRDTVVAERAGWTVVGNRTVYTVHLRHDGETTFAYASDPSRAEPTVAGRNVSFVARDTGFSVRVTDGGTTLGRAAVPTNNSSVRVGGLTLRRNGTRLFAERNGTSVRVGTRERYD
ncbi:rhomboid family intramembrane serine protease [Halosegnis marinus]|uniref:Rhomboid family intramembrane serine protease n=1 Tax=Halosegnis marinus TaxID=3034023 RepID=A0ABD5ZSX0_9EURY|nr:rhomboid family intramembrane serine protease [Halosegnis sp. DT85]